MSVTLTITIDGRTAHSSTVTSDAEIWEAMAAHPPTAARGGVVQATNGRKVLTVAMSRHSSAGPIWGVER